MQFTVTLDNTGELALLLKGTKGQFVDFFMYNKENNCLQHKVVACEMVTGNKKIVIDKTTPGTADFYFSYIYAMKNKNDALGYAQVAPTLFDPSSGVAFNISKKYNLYSTYYNGVYRVYNSGKDSVRLTTLGITIQPGQVEAINNSYYIRKVMDEAIRIDDGTYNNMAYSDLTEQERNSLIPKSIITSGTCTIHWGSYNNWIKSSDYQFKTTLIYHETRDKEFHFTDETTGHKYKYNIDCIRLIFPYLISGKISGTFIYKGIGNRNIRYVPIPLSSGQGEESGLIICESDDSDYDNDN